MYFTSGSDRAFEQLMQTRPGADHFDNGEAGAPEDCGTCRFYRPHWKYQFCVYEECPYQPGKLTALDGAVKFQVKGVDDEMAVFRVEKNRGYTVMSNHHLRNKDLSLKAKGLLSQMLSLPEDWDFTLKGLSLINREQIDAIRAAVRELEQAGYIVRSRERDSQGRLRGADYIIYEQPQPVPDSPTLENPTLDNPTQENPTQEKPTQLNKDRLSKEKSITDGSNTDSIPILSPPSPLGEEAAAPPERKGTGAKSQSAVEIYREIIKDNIEYEMLPTAESLVSGLWPLLPFAAGLDLSPQFGRVLNSKKVSDHHAIVPTMEFVQKGFDGLTEGEKKLLSLVCCKLLCAVAAPHVYEAVTATFTCAGNTFTAKGKTILTPGWKELDRRFKASFKTDADDTAPEPARELPEITDGQTFDKVTAVVTEHFTAPPKSYTLIRKIYEDNVIGRLPDRLFQSMLTDYENEQNELNKIIETDTADMQRIIGGQNNVERFLKLVKKYENITELTPAMINEFIDKILVHEPQGKGADRTTEVEIYLNYVGQFQVPVEQHEPTEEERIAAEKEAERLRRKRESNRKYMKKIREKSKEFAEHERIAEEKSSDSNVCVEQNATSKSNRQKVKGEKIA